MRKTDWDKATDKDVVIEAEWDVKTRGAHPQDEYKYSDKEVQAMVKSFIHNDDNAADSIRHLLYNRSKGLSAVEQLLENTNPDLRLRIAQLLDTKWVEWCKEKKMEPDLNNLAPTLRSVAAAYSAETEFAECVSRMIRRCK